MAGKTRNEVAVGITVLVAVMLTIYIVVMLADWSVISTPQQEITVRLPYQVGLKGLSKDSPVLLGGVKVGYIIKTSIKKIGPPQEDGSNICVYFTIRMPDEYQLRDDCVLMPQSNVLGGQAMLCIENLGSKGNPITDGQTVDLVLADDMMQTIKHQFDPADPDSLLSVVKYEVNRKNKDSLVSSLKNVAAELEEAIPEVTERIVSTLAKAQTALDTTQSALHDLKKLTADERIDKVIGDLSEVGVNLKLTTREVRRAPWKLLYKPKEKEFKIQSLVDAAGSFASGAESLESTAVRLQALIAATEDQEFIDKGRLESVLSHLQASFEQFEKAERKFWEELE
jgi:exonuclease VII small subunit